MHAILVDVSIQPDHMEEAQEQLNNVVLPRVKETPGVAAGYWFNPVEGHGSSVVLFESEEAARQAATMIPNMPRPDFVAFDKIEGAGGSGPGIGGARNGTTPCSKACGGGWRRLPSRPHGERG